MGERKSNAHESLYKKLDRKNSKVLGNIECFNSEDDGVIV